MFVPIKRAAVIVDDVFLPAADDPEPGAERVTRPIRSRALQARSCERRWPIALREPLPFVVRVSGGVRTLWTRLGPDSSSRGRRTVAVGVGRRDAAGEQAAERQNKCKS